MAATPRNADQPALSLYSTILFNDVDDFGQVDCCSAITIPEQNGTRARIEHKHSLEHSPT